jgi:hypothetical protein
MRSEKQREASRVNGSKSKGPITPTGKAVSKFNGLKHGLRAEQVILPGEDPAEFEAERQGWLDDWKPRSHTRAVLCERAAQASWRLRRAVRTEAARVGVLADNAAWAFDSEQMIRVDRAVDRFGDDPAGALAMLRVHAAGVDRLIASWAGLEAALAAGPGGWDRSFLHARLTGLLGHRIGMEPASAETIAADSAGLLAANDRRAAAEVGADSIAPLRGSEAEAAAGRLRTRVAEALGELRAHRGTLPEPALLRARAIAAASADASEEAERIHRYEMAHDRSLRATIAQLMALEKSRAELACEDEACPEGGEASGPDHPQSVTESLDTSDDPAESAAALAGAPGSVGAREAASAPTRFAAQNCGSRGSISVAEPADGGGSSQ